MNEGLEGVGEGGGGGGGEKGGGGGGGSSEGEGGIGEVESPGRALTEWKRKGGKLLRSMTQ